MTFPKVIDRIFWKGLTPAKLAGNLSRFANHSCEPNTFVASLNDYSDITNPRKYFLKALNRIEKGEEITFKYSRKLIAFDCLCMSKSCLKVAGSKLAAIAEMETEPQLAAIADMVTEPQLMDCAGKATSRYSCESEDIHSQIYKSDLLHTIS